MNDKPKCELCGEPMPAGEEMFKFHGYSGECPKPPKDKPVPDYDTAVAANKVADRLVKERDWALKCHEQIFELHQKCKADGKSTYDHASNLWAHIAPGLNTSSTTIGILNQIINAYVGLREKCEAVEGKFNDLRGGLFFWSKDCGACSSNESLVEELTGPLGGKTEDSLSPLVELCEWRLVHQMGDGEDSDYRLYSLSCGEKYAAREIPNYCPECGRMANLLEGK